MKKVFFSFAIAAMMASLMACGNTGGQNNEGQDSTAVEAEAAEEEVAAEEPASNMAQTDKFSGIAPEGWEIVSQDNGGFKIYKNNVEGPLQPRVSVHKAYITPAEAYESAISPAPNNLIGNVELIEAMDIAGRTYSGFYYKTQYKKEFEASKYYIITDLSNGTSIYVQVENIAIDDADVQAIFESIKEK